jgi:hypothetical protein
MTRQERMQGKKTADSNQIKKNEMKGECNKKRRDKRSERFVLKIFRHGRIILKLITMK